MSKKEKVLDRTVFNVNATTATTFSTCLYFTVNRVATKVRTYFEMRTDGQRFFV